MAEKWPRNVEAMASEAVGSRETKGAKVRSRRQAPFRGDRDSIKVLLLLPGIDGAHG